jgi:hypothetical protein
VGKKCVVERLSYRLTQNSLVRAEVGRKSTTSFFAVKHSFLGGDEIMGFPCTLAVTRETSSRF